MLFFCKLAAVLSAMMLILVGPSLPLAFAGPHTLAEWADLSKLEKKIDVEGFGRVKKLKSAGIKVKRVGLISFYIVDSGTAKVSAMDLPYEGPRHRWNGRTLDKESNHFASQLAAHGVPGLKKAFADHGMTLLTPPELIEDGRQLHALTAFELRQERFAKAAREQRHYLQRHPDKTVSARDFRYVPAGLFVDHKSTASLEELRRALGLDALLVVQNTTRTEKSAVIHTGTELYLFGRNPLPRPQPGFDQVAYSKGALYARGRFGKGYKGAEIAQMKRGKIQSEQYDGLARIMEATAHMALSRFDRNYAKGK